MGPLHGLKVLDLSRVLAGPWAAQTLADFGAEVWKIEKPGSGDDTRAWGPPWFGEGDAALSAYYLSANRGKRSVAVDMATPEGSELIAKLAEQADIVLENFKVGGLQKYGLDYARLSARNPRLIYCSITGFGQTGPMAALPGYDAMIQAQGGIMSLTGVPEGEPGAGPQKIGVAAADLMTGMYAVSAILAALHARHASGVGQWIDLSLLDTQVAWLANQAMNYLVSGEVPQRLGTAHPNIVPYQTFKTADGYLALAVGNDRQFQSLCAVCQQSAVASDARFATNAERVRHRDVLVPMVANWLQQKHTDEWLSLLGAANVPCGPINDLQRVFEHPQVKARGVQLSAPDAEGNPVPQVKNPVNFSATPIEYTRAPPRLGADTESVLRDVLKLDDAALAKLRAEKVIA
jgi:crotonobetainyl-CoA:carnitine CoA-transferase CaiB-like acyl-CoA transferase